MKHLLIMLTAAAFITTAASAQAHKMDQPKNQTVAYQKTTHGKRVSTTAKTTATGKDMKDEHGKTVSSVTENNKQSKMTSTNSHKAKAYKSSGKHSSTAIKHHHKKHHHKKHKKSSTKQQG